MMRTPAKAWRTFRKERERREMLRLADEMAIRHPDLIEFHLDFCRKAVGGGLKVTVDRASAAYGSPDGAQAVVNDMLSSCRIAEQIVPWAASLTRIGDLFLNPVLAKDRREN